LLTFSSWQTNSLSFESFGSAFELSTLKNLPVFCYAVLGRACLFEVVSRLNQLLFQIDECCVSSVTFFTPFFILCIINSGLYDLIHPTSMSSPYRTPPRTPGSDQRANILHEILSKVDLLLEEQRRERSLLQELSSSRSTPSKSQPQQPQYSQQYQQQQQQQPYQPQQPYISPSKHVVPAGKVQLDEKELDEMLMRLVMLEEQSKTYESQLNEQRKAAEAALREAHEAVLGALGDQKKILEENKRLKEQLVESLNLNTRLHELLDLAVKELNQKAEDSDSGASAPVQPQPQQQAQPQVHRQASPQQQQQQRQQAQAQPQRQQQVQTQAQPQRQQPQAQQQQQSQASQAEQLEQLMQLRALLEHLETMQAATEGQNVQFEEVTDQDGYQGAEYTEEEEDDGDVDGEGMQTEEGVAENQQQALAALQAQRQKERALQAKLAELEALNAQLETLMGDERFLMAMALQQQQEQQQQQPQSQPQPRR
jgi:hypothetical protein